MTTPNDDLYPGLSQWDSRVSGRITYQGSRLGPADVIGVAVHEGWDAVDATWMDPEYYDSDTLRDVTSTFLGDLLSVTGPAARLLLALAAVEAAERDEYDAATLDPDPWMTDQTLSASVRTTAVELIAWLDDRRGPSHAG